MTSPGVLYSTTIKWGPAYNSTVAMPKLKATSPTAVWYQNKVFYFPSIISRVAICERGWVVWLKTILVL